MPGNRVHKSWRYGHGRVTRSSNSQNAAVEVDLAARNREKSSATIFQLEPDANSGAQGPRANALWDLGLLGNRGVEPQRVAQILMNSVHDPNVNVRYLGGGRIGVLGNR